jgi:flagellar biosynthesis/type III secretory pathway protein FliH
MYSIDKCLKLPVTLAAGLAILAAAGAMMPGCVSGLDCQSDALIGSTQAGRDAAKAQIAADEQAGTNAGNALTYAQGQADGYPIGYNEGYNAGYTSSNGYNRGYNDYYAPGQIAGQSDFNAYADGAADGFNAGFADGRPVGEYDGYEDGYGDGYDSGFPAGQFSCLNGSGGPSEGDRNTCRQRGYDAEYAAYVQQHGARPYDRMYAIAKAANPNYQTGYAAGRAQGNSDGRAVGTTDGYNAGKIDGYADGFAAGQQVAYTNAYNASYPNGYADGYEAGYDDPIYGYGTAPYGGSISNGTGGFGDGYYDGYVDGRRSVCGGTAQTTVAKRYGTTPEGGHARVGMRVVDGRIIAAFSTANKRLTADLQTRIDGLRTQLRTEAKFNNRAVLDLE